MPVIVALLKLSNKTLWDYVYYTERHILKITYFKDEKLVSSCLLFQHNVQTKEGGIPDYDPCTQVATHVSLLTSQFPNQYEE